MTDRSRKYLVVFIILSGIGAVKPLYAQQSVSPRALENFIRRIYPMSNHPQGMMLEERFNITEFRDGKWTCDDRAEIAKRIALRYGYDATYGIDKTSDPKIFHRFIILSDGEGHTYEILRSRLTPHIPTTGSLLNPKLPDAFDYSE